MFPLLISVWWNIFATCLANVAFKDVKLFPFSCSCSDETLRFEKYAALRVYNRLTVDDRGKKIVIYVE